MRAGLHVLPDVAPQHAVRAHVSDLYGRGPLGRRKIERHGHGRIRSVRVDRHLHRGRLLKGIAHRLRLGRPARRKGMDARSEHLHVVQQRNVVRAHILDLYRERLRFLRRERDAGQVQRICRRQRAVLINFNIRRKGRAVHNRRVQGRKLRAGSRPVGIRRVLDASHHINGDGIGKRLLGKLRPIDRLASVYAGKDRRRGRRFLRRKLIIQRNHGKQRGIHVGRKRGRRQRKLGHDEQQARHERRRAPDALGKMSGHPDSSFYSKRLIRIFWPSSSLSSGDCLYCTGFV